MYIYDARGPEIGSSLALEDRQIGIDTEQHACRNLLFEFCALKDEWNKLYWKAEGKRDDL